MKKHQNFPVLEYLKKMKDGSLGPADKTKFIYPTAISRHLNFELKAIELGESKISVNTDCGLHGNQQGTVHGGFLAELADAAIGTAHSTVMQDDESFTSIEFKINFLRPVWDDELIAHAYPVHNGRTIACYHCDIYKSDGKNVAKAISTVMTLRGESAKGR